jgi:hypothetical protein
VFGVNEGQVPKAVGFVENEARSRRETRPTPFVCKLSIPAQVA